MEKKLLHHFLWGQITHLGKKGHCMSEGKERFHQHRFLFQLVKGKCFFFSNKSILRDLIFQRVISCLKLYDPNSTKFSHYEKKNYQMHT